MLASSVVPRHRTKASSPLRPKADQQQASGHVSPHHGRLPQAPLTPSIQARGRRGPTGGGRRPPPPKPLPTRTWGQDLGPHVPDAEGPPGQVRTGSEERPGEACALLEAKGGKSRTIGSQVAETPCATTPPGHQPAPCSASTAAATGWV